MLGGEGVEGLAFVVLEFGEVFFEFFDFSEGFGFFGWGGAFADAEGFEVALAGGEFGLEFAQVVVEDDANGVGAVAVHVDEGVEGAVGAGE